MKRIFVVGLVALICQVIIGCATVENEWKKTTQLNTVESYQEFVSEHPGSEHENQAREMIAKLDWEKALAQNSVESFSEYISKHAKSKYAENAKKKLEQLDWHSAIESNDIDGYRLYLKKHPDSQNASTAQSMVEDLEWNAAQKAGGVDGYKKFLADHPNCKYSQDARVKMTALILKEERAMKQRLCSDKELLKTFPAWLVKGGKNEKQSGPRHTAMNSLYFGPYYFEVHSPISFEIRQNSLIYFHGKGIVTGKDNSRVLVGYDCK